MGVDSSSSSRSIESCARASGTAAGSPRTNRAQGAHLEENIKAAELKLTQDDRGRLDAIFRPEQVAGPRSRDMHRVNI
jgi:hypothetical protein